jgi:hypothetical protein
LQVVDFASAADAIDAMGDPFELTAFYQPSKSCPRDTRALSLRAREESPLALGNLGKALYWSWHAAKYLITETVCSI